MNLGVIDIVVILIITIGPTKAAIMYLDLTAGADPAFKRQVAIRAVGTAAIICVTFVLIGHEILSVFRVTLPALKLAGGLILLLFALKLVLGEEGDKKPDAAARGTPSLDIASYPLAAPLLASPQGLVSILTISAGAQFGGIVLLLALVVLVMGLNLVFLLSADRILKAISPAVLKAALRVFGLLLSGLAVQLMIAGFQDLGLIALPVDRH